MSMGSTGRTPRPSESRTWLCSRAAWAHGQGCGHGLGVQALGGETRCSSRPSPFRSVNGAPRILGSRCLGQDAQVQARARVAASSRGSGARPPVPPRAGSRERVQTRELGRARLHLRFARARPRWGRCPRWRGPAPGGWKPLRLSPAPGGLRESVTDWDSRHCCSQTCRSPFLSHPRLFQNKKLTRARYKNSEIQKNAKEKTIFQNSPGGRTHWRVCSRVCTHTQTHMRGVIQHARVFVTF